MFSPFLLIYGYNVCDGSGTASKSKSECKESKIANDGSNGKGKRGYE